MKGADSKRRVYPEFASQVHWSSPILRSIFTIWTSLVREINPIFLIALADDEANQGSMLILQSGDSMTFSRFAERPEADHWVEFRSI